MKKVLVLAMAFVMACSIVACAPQNGGNNEVNEGVKTIKVGCIYPLTGSLSPIGVASKHAVELAADIVNNTYDMDMTLARAEGLPNLGGAKVEVIYADSQGQAINGQSEAERLITQEGVCAIVGCYQSAVGKTISQVCERLKVPFVVADCASSTLSEPRYRYFFRTGMTDEAYNQVYFDFLEAINAKDKNLKTIACIYENTEAGVSSAKVQKEKAAKYGYEVVLDIPYATGSTDVTSEVQRIKAANPDMVMHNSHVSDAILFTKTYKAMNYAPKLLFADSGGFTTAEYLQSVGEDGNYVICCEGWSLALGKSNPLITKVNDLFFEKYGQNMDGVTARTFMGAMVTFMAINEAGSSNPEDVKTALENIDIPAGELIATWGVRFDPETHENLQASVILNQIIDEEYRVIFPLEASEKDYVMPMPGWSDR